MIVDDHISFRRGLKLMLGEIDDIKEIVEVPDGENFLILLNDYLPDLVFLDIRLPGISGLEAACAAIKQHPLLRIIMLTMFSEEKYLKDAMEAGAKGFIQKPPTLVQLREAYFTVINGNNFFPALLQRNSC